MKILFHLLCVLLALPAFVSAAPRDLEVRWDYDLTLPLLNGFKIIYQVEGSTNKTVIDVPSKVLSAVINVDMQTGKEYVFSMTAYDDKGFESEPSLPYSIIELPTPGLGSIKKKK